MSDNTQNKQSEFIIEKMKERPVNKKKLLRRTAITAAMAVIFGLIACFTFLVLEPVFSNWLYPEKKPQTVVFPEEFDEMSPEDMLIEEEDSLHEALESAMLEDEQIQKILDSINLDKNNYVQLYASMKNYAAELSKSMVVVTSVKSDVDWLNDTYESEGSTYGVILANNGNEYLILTDKNTIKKAESITVTFCDGTKGQAEVKETDAETGLAVVAVALSEVSEETLEKVSVAPLGTSNMKNPVGVPVVALGCPMGTVGSVQYGMISAAGYMLSKVDANYKLLTTDMYGSTNSLGVLFNMQGQIIGIITPHRAYADMKNAVTAIGISDLRKLVENMTNGKQTAYLGITGMDVTAEANQEMGVPLGAYVKEVEMNSPAMLAGVQRGDIIVNLDGYEISSFTQYTATLWQLRVGKEVVVTIQRPVQGSYREIEMVMTLEAAK